MAEMRRVGNRRIIETFSTFYQWTFRSNSVRPRDPRAEKLAWPFAKGAYLDAVFSATIIRFEAIACLQPTDVHCSAISIPAHS